MVKKMVDEKMRLIGRSMKNDDKMAELRKKIKKLPVEQRREVAQAEPFKEPKSVKSIEDIAAAVYGAISAKGFKVVKGLKVASRADLGEITKTLVRSLNTYVQSTDKGGKR